MSKWIFDSNSKEASYYVETFSNLLNGADLSVVSIEKYEDIKFLSEIKPEKAVLVLHKLNDPGQKRSLIEELPNLSKFKNVVVSSLDDVSKLESASGLSPFYIPFSSDIDVCPKNQRILFFGNHSVENRAHKVIKAVSSLQAEEEFIWMVDGNVDEANKQLSEFNINNYQLLPFNRVEDWKELLEAGARVCINTFFSAFGSPGPALNLSLMSGIPCVVSDMGVGASLPGSVAFKTTPGFEEVECITKAIVQAKSDNQIGKEARNYAIEHFSMDSLREEFGSLLC